MFVRRSASWRTPAGTLLLIRDGNNLAGRRIGGIVSRKDRKGRKESQEDLVQAGARVFISRSSLRPLRSSREIVLLPDKNTLGLWASLRELEKRGLSVCAQHPIPVFYQGTQVEVGCTGNSPSTNPPRTETSSCRPRPPAFDKSECTSAPPSDVQVRI